MMRRWLLLQCIYWRIILRRIGGKTTLAKEIFNSKAGGTFETAVMVEISESPNIELIQDQIGGGLGLEMHKAHGILEKATLIYNRLKQEQTPPGGKDDNNAKKILIVLDNIWNKIDLRQMGIPHEYCKRLVTSRKREVCKAMDVQDVNIFEVGLLNKDEAKDLFKFQVQKEVVTGEYNSVADRLLEKCGGLPLAIVATANSLKGKKLPLWRQFADELEKPISCKIPGVRHETFSILRTSYEVMESEDKKKFFLMACLSPIGSSISIDNLMRYGIGLGLFQHLNKLSEAIELTRTWAKELVSSSMLLKGDSDEYVKIHDVVRESTMSFASRSGSGLNTDGQMFLVDAIPRWIFEETFNKYTGISLLAQPNYAPLSGVRADLLEILLLKGNRRNHSSILESNFFQGMTNLKVLEVLYMNFEKGLPESLGSLKVLKTLHLVECKLGDIKLIGELGSLLVLSLRGSSLEGLPDEIGMLYKLRLLDLSKCQCKEPEPRIPANVIARLSLLEGLYLVGSSFIEWAVKETTSSDTRVSTPADIEDLTKLDFLNVLEIRIQELVLPICDQFVKNLDKFQIFVGKEDYQVQTYPRALIVDSQFDVNEELKKDNCLKALLKKADFLGLKSATVNNIVPELDKEGFRDLSYLAVCDIDSISRICEGKAPAGLFHNLCHFRVSNLEKLEVLLLVNPLPRKMTTLEIWHCDNLTYIFSEDGVVNKELDFIELPCLKKLDLIGVSNLISVVKESNNDDSRRPCFFNCKVTLTSLEELSLENNKRIVMLWDKESNLQSFQNLKDLKISNCEELESIGPPSMFLSLVQLESLKIERCKKMKQVISDGSETQEIPKEVITFPKLKHLGIHLMENLECFYGGSYKMACPCLKNLNLSFLEHMTKFAGGITSRAFFPETVQLTSLEELSLCENKSIVQLWDKEPNLHSFKKLKFLIIKYCEELESIGPASMFLNLVQLERLTIECCEKMQQVISDGSETQEIPIEVIAFPKLKHLRIYSMENLECFYGGSYKMSFPCIKTMNLFSLTRMTKLAGGINSTAFFPNTVTLTSLEELSLKYNGGIVKLWNKESNLQSFQNLKNLEISNCKEMETIGPPSMFLSLVQLESLKVEHCEKMQQVISGGTETQEIPEEVITFPKLKRLNIKDMKNLECFYYGSYKMDFPRLENLVLIFLECMTKFAGGINSRAFFPKTVQLASLEELSLHQNKSIVQLWDKELNLHSFRKLKVIGIQNCEKMETIGPPSMFLNLVQLKSLKIGDCDKMQQVISDGSETQEIPIEVITFPKLEHLRITNMENLECFYGGSYKMTFPRLEKLNLLSLTHLTKFAGGINSTAFFPNTVQLTSLEELWLSKNKSIVQLWDKEPNLHSFRKLKVLKIQYCTKMETIGPSSMFLNLVQLERLTIECCHKMQQVISDGSETQEIPIEVITFLKLKHLGIDNMKNLECFYGGSYKMAFPCLEKLDLSSLERMTKFAGGITSTAFFPETIEFPCLEDLKMWYMSDEVRVLWELNEGEAQGISSSNPLPNLRTIFVGKIKLPSIVFPSLSYLNIEPVIGDAKFLFSSSSSENEGCVWTYSQFPKLEQLRIVKDDGSTSMLNFCGHLKSLEIISSEWTRSINIEMTSLHSFTSLRKLSISSLTWEYLFSVDHGFEQLQSLEELTINYCPNMKVIIQGGDNDKALVFPRLKRLVLWRLESMSTLCSISDGEPNQVLELPSLEDLTIGYCDAMKSFSTRPLKAPKLRQLNISNCPAMECFLSGNSNCSADLLELPSLDDVTISKCPKFKSFSPAVLRAPKLQLVEVDDKPYPVAEIEDLNHLLKSANSSEQTAADQMD